jgi:plastocyanin
MRRTVRSLLAALAVLPVFVWVAAFVGCGGSDNPTNPGGGGGPTLNLSIPSLGDTAGFTFNDAGTVVYKCGIHPTMMRDDSVIVEASASAMTAAVSAVSTSHPGFQPQTVRIRPGGRVIWTNGQNTPHTIVNQ